MYLSGVPMRGNLRSWFKSQQLDKTPVAAEKSEWLKRFSSKQRDPRNRLVSESTRGSFSELFDRHGRSLTGNCVAENVQFGEPEVVHFLTRDRKLSFIGRCTFSPTRSVGARQMDIASPSA